MFRLLKPVPGKLIEPSTPDLRPLNVTWNGPSLIDFVNDLMPCSVMLNPAIVRSKLNADFSVTGNNHVSDDGVDKDYDNKK